MAVAETNAGTQPPVSPRIRGEKEGSLPRAHSDLAFIISLSILGGSCVLMIFATLAADLIYTSPGHILTALNSPEIQYALKLSIVSCTLTTVFALWVSVPLGYLLSRYNFP